MSRRVLRSGLFGVALLLATVACDREESEVDIAPIDAEPKQGSILIELFECGACHVIPGVPDAGGTVGPPLTGWAKRSFIAGNVPNKPENLVQWLMDPHVIEPGTAMPDMDISEAQARDIAAYLYTLE